MNSFTFNDQKRNVFRIINDGTVLHELKVKNEFKKELYGILFEAMCIMNYTGLHDIVNYSIEETSKGYTLNLQWFSTPLRAEICNTYYNAIKKKQVVVPPEINWKSEVLKYTQKLVSRGIFFTFYNEKIEKNKYRSHIIAGVSFKQLLRDNDYVLKSDVGLDSTSKRFSVPYELLENIINENLIDAGKYFGKDHEKLISLLLPFSGKEFYADFLIGASYYMFQNMPNKAYEHFKRSLNLLKDKNDTAKKIILDFMANIEFVTKQDPAAAQQSLIRSMLVGNQQSFLKLAYIYLQRAVTEKKEMAYALADIGEQILPYDEDKDHRLSGYHIVASVYLWNKKFNDAEAAHHFFFSDTDWCNNNIELIRAYVVFAIVVGNKDFISNLIIDNPIVLSRFRIIIETWQYAIINPHDERFQSSMIQIINLINNAKKLYQFQ